MKMDFNITKVVEEIAMQAKENQEEFIFETIRPYCEDILQMKINKKELEQILLKQQSCEDCISRKAVLDALDKSKYTNEFCEEHHIDWSINLGMAHIVVNELKPVTPTRPTGKWISRWYGDKHFHVCSECSKEFSYDAKTGIDITNYNFCPNCGAKLKEEDPDY